MHFRVHDRLKCTEEDVEYLEYKKLRLSVAEVLKFERIFCQGIYSINEFLFSF